MSSHYITAYRRPIIAMGCLALLAACQGQDVVKDTQSSSPTVPVAAAPSTPTNLTATAGNAQASLSWTASSGATSYTIRRATTSGGPFVQVATPSATSYTDSSLVNGTTYFYVASAVGSGGESANTAPVSATPKSTTTTTPASAPSAPSNLTATAGNAQVSLSWSASSGATSYNIKRSITSGGSYTQIATATTTSYTDTSLTNGTTYYYVVSAVSSAGESANASEVNATPKAPVALPPVGTCDHLPAAGTWENITPQGTGSTGVNGTASAAIIVDPFNAERLWLGTSLTNKDIWRSDDCGASWTKVNTGPGSAGDGKTYGGVGDGAQWSMQADFVDQGTLFAASGYGANDLWKTTDGGYSWTDVLANTDYLAHVVARFINNVSMDPTNHLHLVVTAHGDCTAPYAPSCIGETRDGGKTWSTITAPEGWTEGGGLIIVKDKTWIWCGTTMKLTTDGGQTWSSNVLTGAQNCEAEYTIRSFVPAGNGKYYLGSRNGVLRSSDGMSWQKITGGPTGYPVMIAQGSTKVFASDQWYPHVWMASLSNDGSWTDLGAPPQISQGTDGGIPFLAYDDVHGILYASMYTGGVARMVIAK